MKENSPDFYSAKEVEDISFPALRDEVVVLETPGACNKLRIYGFKFKSNVKEELYGFFK